MSTFRVPSSSTDDVYDVVADITSPRALDEATCTCRDHKQRHRPCKHIRAVLDSPHLFATVREGTLTETVVAKTGELLSRPLPMLAKPWPGWKSNRSFAVEEKYDGLRCVARVSDTGVDVWSRTGKDGGTVKNRLTAEIRKKLQTVPSGVYDGELVSITEGTLSKSYTVATIGSALCYRVFDLLELLGRDTTQHPLHLRRTWLEQIFPSSAPSVVELAPQWVVSSEAELDSVVGNIWERGGEGVIVKDVNAKYFPGKRSDAFMKIKQCVSASLEVVGFAESEGEINNRGPAGITVLRDEQGNYTLVKTLDDATCAKLASRFLGTNLHRVKIANRWVTYNSDHTDVGRRLRIEYQERTPEGSYRHGRWDRWEDE